MNIYWKFYFLLLSLPFKSKLNLQWRPQVLPQTNFLFCFWLVSQFPSFFPFLSSSLSPSLLLFLPSLFSYAKCDKYRGHLTGFRWIIKLQWACPFPAKRELSGGSKMATIIDKGYWSLWRLSLVSILAFAALRPAVSGRKCPNHNILWFLLNRILLQHQFFTCLAVTNHYP